MEMADKIENQDTSAPEKEKAPLTQKDKEILEALKPVVDGIALAFGENCEVLLHSFETLEKSIVYIKNGNITGRSVGSPITDLGMKILNDVKEKKGKDGFVTGVYHSQTTDGKSLRSVTVLIRNTRGKPIGMLCINFNMSGSLQSFINGLIEKGPENTEGAHENFVNSIDDLITVTLKDTVGAINRRDHIPNHEKNKYIVYELDKKGIFDIRGAIDIVARELSLSRYTIYNYIRENKYLTPKTSRTGRP
jgi:predicted transcriptional regulator YheO